MIRDDLKVPTRADYRNSRVRFEYFIERCRVVFESGSQWLCPCADFAASNVCSHTREAAGRHSAQAQIAARIAAGRSQLAANSPPTARAQPRKSPAAG